MDLGDYVVDRIEDLCRTRGISKYKLSQLSGISHTEIGKIMKRKRLPTLPTLLKICSAFQISLAQFFSGDNDISIDLTDEQKEILTTWNMMNREEQRIFLNIVRSIRK